jgi:uncharacterized membrane protein YfcA
MGSAVVVAACVQGTIGIGFALMVAPVMAFSRPDLLPVSLLLLMLPLNLLVGAATVAVAAFTMLAPAFSPSRSALAAVGLFTGISETATGIGGPPLALAYQHHRPDVLRSTVAGCFLLGELVSLGVLAAIGRVSWQQAWWAFLLLPFLVVGGLLSSWVRHGVNAKLLRGLVLAFALISGALLILRG